LKCRWQRHSVKTFLLRRVAVPIEEEEEEEEEYLVHRYIVTYIPLYISIYQPCLDIAANGHRHYYTHKTAQQCLLSLTQMRYRTYTPPPHIL